MIQLDDEVDAFCRPDRSQMIPFKPRRFPAPGSHPVQGGEYPMPEGQLIPDPDSPFAFIQLFSSCTQHFEINATSSLFSRAICTC